jgi:hypothetical protein
MEEISNVGIIIFDKRTQLLNIYSKLEVHEVSNFDKSTVFKLVQLLNIYAIVLPTFENLNLDKSNDVNDVQPFNIYE